jgi:hypothetical protein
MLPNPAGPSFGAATSQNTKSPLQIIAARIAARMERVTAAPINVARFRAKCSMSSCVRGVVSWQANHSRNWGRHQSNTGATGCPAVQTIAPEFCRTLRALSGRRKPHTIGPLRPASKSAWRNIGSLALTRFRQTASLRSIARSIEFRCLANACVDAMPTGWLPNSSSGKAEHVSRLASGRTLVSGPDETNRPRPPGAGPLRLHSRVCRPFAAHSRQPHHVGAGTNSVQTAGTGYLEAGKRSLARRLQQGLLAARLRRESAGLTATAQMRRVLGCKRAEVQGSAPSIERSGKLRTQFRSEAPRRTLPNRRESMAQAVRSKGPRPLGSDGHFSFHPAAPNSAAWSHNLRGVG